MYTFNGRNIYLEQLTTLNDYQLFELMKNNENEYRFYVSDQPIPQTFEEFRESLKRFFDYDRIYQFLVYRKRDNKLIGTIFFYTEDNEVKISAFFIPEARLTILPTEALGASILFALDVLKIERLNFDCYKENEKMIELANKIGAEKIYERRSDINPEREIIGFIISKEQLEKLKEKFIRFESKEKKIK